MIKSILTFAAGAVAGVFGKYIYDNRDEIKERAMEIVNKNKESNENCESQEQSESKPEGKWEIDTYLFIIRKDLQINWGVWGKIALHPFIIFQQIKEHIN